MNQLALIGSPLPVRTVPLELPPTTLPTQGSLASILPSVSFPSLQYNDLVLKFDVTEFYFLVETSLKCPLPAERYRMFATQQRPRSPEPTNLQTGRQLKCKLIYEYVLKLVEPQSSCESRLPDFPGFEYLSVCDSIGR